MNNKNFVLIALILLLAGLLIGCGGGDSGSSNSGNGSESVEVKPREAEVAAGDPVAGEKQFQQLCSACHGPDAKGMPSLGKDLTTSDFLKTKSDAEFVEFIKTGRPSSDPENTTGIDMPPKGGNPALTEENMHDIVAYVRTLEE